MKVVKQKSQVKVDGVETKQFGIVFDRHMVNILSNQLYEDKVLAIIRELSTNALDSHRDAGCSDKPFDVFLPTWTNPEFYIRDYGTGMSPDKVDNIYRNYGASDRGDSNDFTGCMGLGSKTPFCYNTRSFTVDSWYNGIHYQYACFLDEDGMPQIAQICSEPSDEPSGVKVAMPTKDHDRYEFEEAASKIYKFFDVVPNLVGSKVKIAKPEYTLCDDNWKYDDNDRCMRIIMGNVAYEVNDNALGDLSTIQRRVANNGFHVYVNIGDVGVTASREGLDYTNRTKTHIRGYINKIIQSFNQKAQDEISTCKNLWEARVKFVKYEHSSLNGIFDPSKITYDGKALFDRDNVIDCSKMIKDGKIAISDFGYSSWRKPERRNANSIYVNAEPKFYINDLKVGGFVRSIAEVQKYQKTVILVTFKDDSCKQEFYDLLGLDESYFTNISTIPSPTVSGPRTSRGKTTKILELIVGHSSRKNSYHWNNVEKDLNDGGVYIEFNRYNGILYIGNHRVCLDMQKIQSYIRVLQNAGINIPKIYGIKTAVLPSIKNKSNWQDFWSWAVEKVLTSIKNFDLNSAEFYANELSQLGYNGYYTRYKMDIDKLVNIAKYCDDSTYLAKFVTKVKQVQELAKNSETVSFKRRACEVFQIPIPSCKIAPTGLKTMEDEVYNRYRLLKHFRDDSVDAVHVGYYINSIDKEI